MDISERPRVQRQPSMRLNNRLQFEENLNAQLLLRFGLLLCCFSLAVAVATVLTLLSAGLAFSAFIWHRDEPCDVPLANYIFILFALSFVKKHLIQRLAKGLLRGVRLYSQVRAQLVQGTLDLLYTGGSLSVGVYYLKISKTCAETNPMLYYPVRRYIYMFGITFALGLLLGTGLSIVLRYFVVRGYLVKKVGCAKAIEALPQVEFDPAVLRDVDGTMQECCICQEDYSPGKVIVKTACGHLFHKECLAHWCASHLTCPLCRKTLGEGDSEV